MFEEVVVTLTMSTIKQEEISTTQGKRERSVCVTVIHRNGIASVAMCM